MVFGAIILAVAMVLAIMSPWIAPHDPTAIDPAVRLEPPGSAWWFGTDSLGRDVFSRVIWGGRISLLVGFSVALLASGVGLALGLVAGYFRWIDAVVMSVTDGLMAIPGVLLAMALMALWRASVISVIIAIAVPEIPRVVRLVRGVVLSLRERPYVDAARTLGAHDGKIILRHIVPNVAGPLIVQGSFICASAILVEAYLSFLGVGTPTEIPSWGNMMAEGRDVISLAFWPIGFAGAFLAITVLAVNLVGDALRDILDPHLSSWG